VICLAAGAASAALSVSPVHIRMSGASSRAITITNAGNAAAAVEARPGGFMFDRRGRPTLARGRWPAAGWLRVRPQRLMLAPGGTAIVTVTSVAPAGALAGDHAALVLLRTRSSRAAGVAIRMQIGVVVYVRVAGRIVHRLELGGLHARRRVLEAAVVNRGNVVERVRIRVALFRRGRVVARLGSVARTLLPHSRAVERFRYRRRVRGWVTVRVEAGALRRSFRIRL
jgi:hypothetical protein